MAIFVHNNPSTAIGQGPPPPPDTFINTLHQLRRERQDQANRSRELDINEKRYQDYLGFRREELDAKKAIEDRLYGLDEKTTQKKEADDAARAEFGYRQLQQEIKALEGDFNLYTGHINRLSKNLTNSGLTQDQIVAFVDGTATPPDQLKQSVNNLRHAVRERDKALQGANQITAQYNREFGLGSVLGVNSNTGRFSLSAPYIPGGRTAVESNAGPLRAGPLSEAPETAGTPATMPGEIELSGGTGESIPLPQLQPQPIQRQQMTGVMPSFYRDVSPSVRAMASGAGQRFSEYAKNVGNFVGSTPYRYWFSGEPMDVTINRPEIRQPGFSEEAPALAERIGRAFLDKFRSQPSPEDNSLKALIDRAAADRAAAAATDRGPFAPSISDEELRRIINPTYFLGY